jgi:hypothetical protein
MRYIYHKDKKPATTRPAAVGRIFARMGSTWLSPDPPANLNLSGPVPEGTVNGYGMATWIPDGYPTKVQPYLYQGRLVLRPLAPVTEVNVQAAIPYIMAALQVAISRYSSTPYSILYSNSLGNAPSRIQNQTLSQINHFALAGAGTDDWLALPAQPTGLDDILTFSSKVIPDAVAAGLNAFVPGLGSAVLKAVTAATATPASVENTAAFQNEVTSLANSAGSSSIFSSLLTGSIIPGVKNIWLLGAFALLAVYDLTQ